MREFNLKPQTTDLPGLHARHANKSWALILTSFTLEVSREEKSEAALLTPMFMS